MIILFKRKEIERRVLFPLSLKSLTSPSHREKEREHQGQMKRRKKRVEIYLYIYLFDLAGGSTRRVCCIHNTAHDGCRREAQGQSSKRMVLLVFRYTSQRIYIEEFFQMSRVSQYLLPVPGEIREDRLMFFAFSFILNSLNILSFLTLSYYYFFLLLFLSFIWTALLGSSIFFPFDFFFKCQRLEFPRESTLSPIYLFLHFL
jgi:hypothetical protein